MLGMIDTEIDGSDFGGEDGMGWDGMILGVGGGVGEKRYCLSLKAS